MTDIANMAEIRQEVTRAELEAMHNEYEAMRTKLEQYNEAAKVEIGCWCRYWCWCRYLCWCWSWCWFWFWYWFWSWCWSWFWFWFWSWCRTWLWLWSWCWYWFWSWSGDKPTIAYVSSSQQQLKSHTTILVSNETAVISKEVEAAETLLELRRNNVDVDDNINENVDGDINDNDDVDDNVDDDIVEHDKDTESMSSSPSSSINTDTVMGQQSIAAAICEINTDAVMEQLKIADKTGDINTNSIRRLHMLVSLLRQCQLEGLNSFVINSTNKTNANNATNATNAINATDSCWQTNATKLHHRLVKVRIQRSRKTQQENMRHDRAE